MFTHRINRSLLCSLLLLIGFGFSTQVKADLTSDVIYLGNGWAKAKYQTPPNQQERAFLQLIERGEKTVKQYPGSAHAHMWLGTIYASYAGVKGGMGALKYAKAARSHLETSININPRADKGFALGVLGALYARVPGFPVAFGSDKKAMRYLESAIELNPNGLDANYYMGDFLADQGNFKAARVYLNRAKKAPFPKERSIHHQGRLAEIKASMAKLR